MQRSDFRVNQFFAVATSFVAMSIDFGLQLSNHCHLLIPQPPATYSIPDDLITCRSAEADFLHSP